VTSSWGGRRKLPFAFTEHGVVMLSSVLNSKIAELRKLLMLYMEKNDKRVNDIIVALNNLIEHPKPTKTIGFTAKEKSPKYIT